MKLMLASLLIAGSSAASAAPSLGLPVASISQVSAIREAYSESAACPWGFVHRGIDLFPAGSMVATAAESGKVAFVQVGKNGADWRVNVMIEHAPDYSIEYAFEPFSSADSDRDAQLAAILVKPGQTVGRGAAIGRLIAVGSAAHIHFSARKAFVDYCPAPSFTPPVRNELLAKLRQTWPGAELCYP